MRWSIVGGAVALPAAVFGAPAAKAPAAAYSAAHSAQCKAVNVFVGALRLSPTASKFCSSYLKIPTITSTATSTSTSVVPATATSFTATSVITEGSINTISETSTVTTFTLTEVASFTNVVTVTEPTSTITECRGTVVAANAPSKRDQAGALVERRAVQTPYGLKAAKASQISAACRCLNIATPTTTITRTASATSTSTTTLRLISSTSTTQVTGSTTSTVLVTTSLATTTSSTEIQTETFVPSTTIESCPAPTACDNQGLQFAVYPSEYYNTGIGYPDFNPIPFKSQRPECSGITNTLGGFIYPESPIGVTIYGQCTRSSSAYFAINQRGYIYAQQSGTYTFSASNIDDIVELWIGATAYSGWTRQNADLDQAIFDPATPYTVDLTAGQYYPVRIVFGQAQGPGAFQMTVTAPDGTEFLGPNSEESPYLVSYSCDGTTAPEYAPFGQEA